MLVKDEEKYLNYCIDSVKDIINEIIIVDTGSTDNTLEIAKTYTDKIIQVPMQKDFAKMRQLSTVLATSTHILWLDADEIFLKSEAKQLKELINDVNCDFFSFPRYNFWKSFNKIFSYPDRQLKLYRNLNNFAWSGKIHENIVDLYGNQLRVKEVDIHTYHFAYMKSKDNVKNKLAFYYNIIHNDNNKVNNTRYVAKHGFFNKNNESKIQDFIPPKELLDIFK